MSDGGGRCCEGLPVAQARSLADGQVVICESQGGPRIGSGATAKRPSLGRGSWVVAVAVGGQAGRARLALELLTATVTLDGRRRRTAEKREMAKAGCAVSLPWFMCRLLNLFPGTAS